MKRHRDSLRYFEQNAFCKAGRVTTLIQQTWSSEIGLGHNAISYPDFHTRIMRNFRLEFLFASILLQTRGHPQFRSRDFYFKTLEVEFSEMLSWWMP